MYRCDISVKSDIGSLGPIIWLMTVDKMLRNDESIFLDHVIYQYTEVDGEYILWEFEKFLKPACVTHVCVSTN